MMYVVLSVAKGYTQHFEDLESAKISAFTSSKNANCDMVVTSKPDDDLRRVLAVYSNGHCLFERES